MAEELQEVEAQEVEAEQTETDWKAKYESMREHMRDWEKKAKANQSAADELEQLKAAQMTELEKSNARAEAAEAELQQLKAEKAKVDAANKLSSETGVPFEMLMFCENEDAMSDFARKYAKDNHVSSAPNFLGGARIVHGSEQKQTARDQFATLLENAGF